jgi:hypothetical protein
MLFIYLKSVWASRIGFENRAELSLGIPYPKGTGSGQILLHTLDLCPFVLTKAGKSPRKLVKKPHPACCADQRAK